MSDTDTSGAPTSAPAATAGSTPSAASPGASQPFGTFGSTRGSGLARGKRATPAGAPASAPAGPGGYQPSALEVIRPQSEYKNPFTGETSVGAPVVNEPAPQAAPLPAPTAFQPVAPVVAPATAAYAPAPASPTSTGDLFPFNAGRETVRTPSPTVAPASMEKPELKILPPAETKRPATSWESGPSEADDRRNERPTFRPERRESKPYEGAPREGKPFEAREPKPFAPKPFTPREPRRDNRSGDSRSNPNSNASSGGQGSFAPRGPRPATVDEPKKSGGFFAWLKNLFSGGPAETTPAGRPDADQRRERDGDFNRDGQRRRHRGGRGRGGFQGDNRGPRDGQSYQPRDPRDEAGPSSSEGGERNYGGGGGGQGEYRGGGGGGGRRRRRGGRGRYRGEGGGGEGGGGDRGNDPRPEGQQGGGAI